MSGAWLGNALRSGEQLPWHHLGLSLFFFPSFSKVSISAHSFCSPFVHCHAGGERSVRKQLWECSAVGQGQPINLGNNLF